MYGDCVPTPRAEMTMDPLLVSSRNDPCDPPSDRGRKETFSRRPRPGGTSTGRKSTGCMYTASVVRLRILKDSRRSMLYT